MKKEIERYVVGGDGVEIPEGVIRSAIGTIISVDKSAHEFLVPISDFDGQVAVARIGDTIIAYDDGSFGVKYAEEDDEAVENAKKILIFSLEQTLKEMEETGFGRTKCSETSMKLAYSCVKNTLTQLRGEDVKLQLVLQKSGADSKKRN